jgi:hypothetical protein
MNWLEQFSFQMQGSPGRTSEGMDQRIKRTERYARRIAPLDPNIEKAGEKLREFVVVEAKAALDLAGRTAGKGRIDWKLSSPSSSAK